MGSRRSTGLGRRLRAAACVAWGGLGLWFVGCESGMPPTHVIPETGDPTDYLPPGVITPGTQLFTDSLYVYDRRRFTLYSTTRQPFVPVGTNRRFIKRGEVLSIPGATQAQIRNPTTVPGPDGDLLRQIYSRPYLFGFEIGDAATAGFIAGSRYENSETLLPLNGGGPSWWDYNHVQFQWTRRDTLAGPAVVSTSLGGPDWRVRTLASVRADLATNFQPANYRQDIVYSVLPGRGLFLHGFTLVAERDEVVPEDEFRVPQPQRNPRFLWVAKGGLGGTSTSEREFTSLDQCVDGLWGEIEQFPVQLGGRDVQVGERYVTWTYVTADSAAIRRRALGPAASGGLTSTRDSLRCIGFGVPPQNVPVDSPAFPIFYMSLLARYEVKVERMFDQFQFRIGNSVVGSYGTADGVTDVVKLVVEVSVGSPVESIVQRSDLYLMRGIGLVVQQVGTDPNRILVDTSRLRQATIDGVLFDQAFFGYQDN